MHPKNDRKDVKMIPLSRLPILFFIITFLKGVEIGFESKCITKTQGYFEIQLLNIVMLDCELSYSRINLK